MAVKLIWAEDPKPSDALMLIDYESDVGWSVCRTKAHKRNGLVSILPMRRLQRTCLSNLDKTPPR
jgi:hypothetical protein